MTDPADDLLESGELSDVTLLVGEEKVPIKAHRVLLAKSSPVFKAMFFGDLAEKRDTVTLCEECPIAFKIVLRHVYHKHFNVDSFDSAVKVFCISKKYLLSELSSECCQYFESTFDVKNVLIVYDLAVMFCDTPLIETSLKYFSLNASDVLKSPAFLKMRLDTIGQLFRQDELNISSELELIRAMQRYVDALDLPKNRPDVRRALSNIRYLTLTPTEFVECEAIKELFDESDRFKLLTNVCSPRSAMPMPDGFHKLNYFRSNPHLQVYFKRSICDIDCSGTIEDNSVGIIGISSDREMYLEGLLIATVFDLEEPADVDLIITLLDEHGAESAKRRVTIERLGRSETRVYFPKKEWVVKNSSARVQIQVLKGYKFVGKYTQMSVSGSYTQRTLMLTVINSDDVIGSLLRGIIYTRG